MPTPHGPRPALAASTLLLCALTLTTAGCDSGRHTGPAKPSPTVPGKLIDTTDEDGHRLRQVREDDAPEVDLVVRPASADGWDLRLTVHRFRFSPAGDDGGPARHGRGQARLYLDGRSLARLHGPGYHLPSRLVSRGTHQVTARLYADDSTVWAVRGKPVETTADLTAAPER
ncbi:hypothetical protein [Streptomyces sp. NPDC050560]|uniref:hypothetical protein n=1 Tax=Streptomyces sp. NPDC050560 TaxID=3365630 RepID=UPI0037B93DDA